MSYTIGLSTIKEILVKYGIDCFGVCDVSYDERLYNFLEERKKRDYLSGMEEQNNILRSSPKEIMDRAKSIIVVAFPYYCGYEEDSNISIYCKGMDYHLVVKGILEKVCDDIRNISKSNPCFMIFSDTGPLVDRYLAYKSGVGYFGLNNNIITDKYGSYIFIGYVVTDIDIEKSTPDDRECLKCGKCIEMCPGKALDWKYVMNAKKCISYITQKKGELHDDERAIIGKNNSVFGCDVCQRVCPHNHDVCMTELVEFKEKLISRLEKDEIDSLSNKEFKRKYGNRAFSWRGKGIIKRNIDIIEEFRQEEIEYAKE